MSLVFLKWHGVMQGVQHFFGKKVKTVGQLKKK